MREAPATGVVPLDRMIGDEEEDTKLLHQMYDDARRYLEGFSWCRSVVQSYFGAGIGGIVAIFLFQIEPVQDHVDEWLWVIVGDFPSAYLVLDKSHTPVEALRGYIEEMRKWVALAFEGRSSRNVISVNVPATPEWADALATRLDVLERKILPILSIEKYLSNGTDAGGVQ